MKDEAVTPTRPFQIPATIKVGLSDDREPAISVEAMMDLGWIKLPLGALAALASRMARGQRLTGAVHHVDGRLVLTATSVGVARLRCGEWRRLCRPKGTTPSSARRTWSTSWR